ncbi:hypothetical protein F2Q69_00007198 [Brassica cretica]|uniref:Uncharacterized protein n=1 Tax=Brassica cretica TaxID=69181 RepID=A0A8S9PC69_BRACR|nr:hypothetical protein F2Q69_00007198 [Brassica cretica]
MHLVFFSLNNRVVGEAFNHYKNIMFQLRGNEVIIKVAALAERGEFSLTHELFSLGKSFASEAFFIDLEEDISFIGLEQDIEFM